MTRKDYVLIAEALKNARPDPHGTTISRHRYDGWHVSACALADALANDNPRFDRERFLKACGAESSGCGATGPNGYACTHHENGQHVARGTESGSFAEAWNISEGR